MKGGHMYGVRGKQLFLTFISISCTTILIWAWEKTATAKTLLAPYGSLDAISHDMSLMHPGSEQQDMFSYTPKEDSLSYLETEVERNDQWEQVSGIAPTGLSSVTYSRKRGDVHIPHVVDCNYAKGKWVPDNKRPLYSGFECKEWLSEMWACRLTQRTDFSYEGFRWLPDGCEIPDFEASAFLERHNLMKDKTIALVGDSLGRQQFQSLMCMATGGKDSSEVKDIGGEYGLVKAPGAVRPNGWAYWFRRTNTTILYYWSATLCDLEPLNISNPSTDIAMHLDRPAWFLRQYLHKFDVLLLNTGHHWNRGKINANRWVMHVGGIPVKDRKLAMIGNARNFTVFSVIRWLDSQLPRHPRLKAFLRTISPRHFMNGEWNTGGSCDSTIPLARGGQVLQNSSSDDVAESAVKGTKVKLLDITALSQLREEGHISRYSIKASPGMQDCLHWCLPGIPDTWNEILAAQV